MSLIAGGRVPSFLSKTLAPKQVRFALALSGLLLFYALRYLRLPARPQNATWGWATWWDQTQYLRAAQAWANGDLAASSHWYLPGYSMMAAALQALAPSQPVF